MPNPIDLLKMQQSGQQEGLDYISEFVQQVRMKNLLQKFNSSNVDSAEAFQKFVNETKASPQEAAALLQFKKSQSAAFAPPTDEYVSSPFGPMSKNTGKISPDFKRPFDKVSMFMDRNGKIIKREARSQAELEMMRNQGFEEGESVAGTAQPNSPGAALTQLYKDNPAKLEELFNKQHRPPVNRLNITRPPSGYRFAEDGETLEPIPGGPAGNRSADSEMKMRKEFQSLPEVKRHVEMETQIGRLDEAMAEAKTSNSMVAVDQALINIMNRMVDPESVVRESEYARTKQDIDLINRVKGGVLKLGEGGAGLTPEIREAIHRMATKFYDVSKAKYGSQVDYYSDLANRYGYDPKNIVRLGGAKNSTEQADFEYIPGKGLVRLER